MSIVAQNISLWMKELFLKKYIFYILYLCCLFYFVFGPNMVLDVLNLMT